jgi:superoxide dismutase, Fe-Mn family
MSTTYQPRKWNLSGLQGISDKTLETHFGLYEGYVKNTNLLNEKIAAALQGGAGGADPSFAEVERRLGFEYNGMRLHEYYFDNLTAKPAGAPSSGKLYDAIGASFGDFAAWQKYFSAIGGMRGIGWAALLQDPVNGALSNHWITLHEEGNVAGFNPILIMDLWEHAYLLDYKPSEKGKYVEAFMGNVDWAAVEGRLTGAPALAGASKN